MLHRDAWYWLEGHMVGDGIFGESISVTLENTSESEGHKVERF